MLEFVETIINDLKSEGWTFNQIFWYTILWVLAFAVLIVLGCAFN